MYDLVNLGLSTCIGSLSLQFLDRFEYLQKIEPCKHIFSSAYLQGSRTRLTWGAYVQGEVSGSLGVKASLPNLRSTPVLCVCSTHEPGVRSTALFIGRGSLYLCGREVRSTFPVIWIEAKDALIHDAVLGRVLD